MKNRTKINLMPVFACLAILLILAGFGAFKVKAADGTAEPNIYIENVCVSGKNDQEIRQALQDKLNELSQGTIKVNVGEQSAEIPVSQLGLYCVNGDIVEKILAMGNKGNIWQKYEMKSYLENSEPVIFELDLAVDPELVRAAVESICVPLNIQRQDMKLVMGDDGILYPTDKTDGLYVDVDQTTSDICEYLDNGWHGGYGEINAVTVDDPAVGDAETYSQVDDVLGVGTTLYAETEDQASRNVNIAVGVSKINGTIVYPGEEFSTEAALVPFTAENGYEEANTILNGEYVEDFGGGICQVASTLYRAVLEAELEVTERCEHSLMVGYVDPSMDASIAEGIKDLKFVNNTDAPIYIEGYVSGGVVEFKIYGRETRDPGRDVDFKGEIVNEYEYEDRIVLDPSYEYGYIKEQAGHDGADAVAYKYVYQDGQLISTEQIATSYYAVVDHVYTVGIDGATSEQLRQLQTYADNYDVQSLIIMLDAY